ncbi:MAG TPA: hypothetical protein VF808_08140 [Ktedonobacterales bacterium]
MEAGPEFFAGSAAAVSDICATCPLRIAMERIAQAALRQHVLYLEGECQPRLELVRKIEESSTLERFIRARVCPVSRESTLATGELEDVVEALRCWDIESALRACATASVCPLGD